MNTHQPYLQVSNIRGYYGESYIVQDVSFSLEESQVLALLGRNGAGKNIHVEVYRTGGGTAAQGRRDLLARREHARQARVSGEPGGDSAGP